jgi:hypothetical protein
MPLLDQPMICTVAGKTPYESIVASIKKGECILFLGAGVHFPSKEFKYDEAVCPPLGTKFSEDLAGACSFAKLFPSESVRNLQRVSMCYELEHGRKSLVDKIQSAVDTGKKPSPAVCALAKLPFQLIITTNYDRLFEEALVKAGKRPVVHVYNPKDGEKTPDHLTHDENNPYIFKLHGDIQSPESIVISDEDYIQFVLRMSEKESSHPVPQTFRYNLSRWPTLFVGYSLLDYNLRLLFKTLRWKMDLAQINPAYSVDPYPDPLIFDVWHSQKKYVTFVAQDVWTFVPALYKKVTGKAMPKNC